VLEELVSTQISTKELKKAVKNYYIRNGAFKKWLKLFLQLRSQSLNNVF
jgi:hypothetical protein